MGKRYYCDYCDKSFADNPISRKTHLTGNAHLQNKKAHYEALRDEKEILQDDQNKKPCRAFLSTGECRFGQRCQYSHLTNEDRAWLIEKVRRREEAAELKLQGTSSKLSPSSAVEKCVERHVKRLKLESAETEGESKSSKSIKQQQAQVPEYKMAESLLTFPNLPPSLLPPSRDAILNSSYAEWG